MKRRIGLIAAAMSLWLMAACAVSPSTETVAPGKRTALFVGRESGGDALVIKHIKALGYQVDVTADKELTADKAAGHTLVFISSTVNSGKVSSKLKTVPVPVVYAESQNIGDLDLSGRETDTDNGDFSGTSIAIQSPEHPMAAGLKGSVEVYQQPGKIGFVVPTAQGVIVASAPDNKQKAVIWALEKGAKNSNNEVMPARQAYFYLVGGEEINQTEAGWKLLDASVTWVTGKQ